MMILYLSQARVTHTVKAPAPPMLRKVSGPKLLGCQAGYQEVDN